MYNLRGCKNFLGEVPNASGGEGVRTPRKSVPGLGELSKILSTSHCEIRRDWARLGELKDNGNKNFYSLFYSIGINGIEELCFFLSQKSKFRSYWTILYIKFNIPSAILQICPYANLCRNKFSDVRCGVNS